MVRNWRDIRAERTASPEAEKGYQDAARAYDLGRKVRNRRLELGLSQTALAKAVGTSQPAIARLEGGGTEPSLRTLRALSRVLHASWLIGPEGVRAISAEHEQVLLKSAAID